MHLLHPPQASPTIRPRQLFATVLAWRILAALAICLGVWSVPVAAAERPNIILMMADDQGWGETSYYNHPRLKTPNLDAMARGGLQLDRYYAAAPVCSPTRASVLTGRTNNRTGVESHGYALRLQEKTIAQALQKAGYRTGHFGKWHLNGFRGPGAPVLAEDDHNPSAFGFDEWLSVTNFFDRDPILGRQGKIEEYQGDSSEVVVQEAEKFISKCVEQEEPFFTVIWFGTPHSPFRALEKDQAPFSDLNESSMHHYGELRAMDRSIGSLRKHLRELKIADDTLFWFCSDNGGLPGIEPTTVGNLRGFKGQIYEGGLRVPCVIEWPNRIAKGRQSSYPAVAMDIFPTLLDVATLADASNLRPQDGLSLAPLFERELKLRPKPIPFNCFGETAIIDNDWKLLHVGKKKTRKDKRMELYNLAQDPGEQNDLSESEPEKFAQLQSEMDRFLVSLEQSMAGKDYPEGSVNPGEPAPSSWTDSEMYSPFFDDWRDRPEYKRWLKDK
ncbi:MAG: sulfatase-like hydrolase/transferase [Pirellulaceae bacterium]